MFRTRGMIIFINARFKEFASTFTRYLCKKSHPFYIYWDSPSYTNWLQLPRNLQGSFLYYSPPISLTNRSNLRLSPRGINSSRRSPKHPIWERWKVTLNKINFLLHSTSHTREIINLVPIKKRRVNDKLYYVRSNTQNRLLFHDFSLCGDFREVPWGTFRTQKMGS